MLIKPQRVYVGDRITSAFLPGGTCVRPVLHRVGGQGWPRALLSFPALLHLHMTKEF